MRTVNLSISDILQTGEDYYFARTVLSRKTPKALHGHDFYEVFWLNNGKALHKINGNSETLTEGDLRFIRPGDVHSLQAKEDESHVVNIAFPTNLIDGLHPRHGAGGRFFWSKETIPDGTHRDMKQLRELSKRALTLETAPRAALFAEAFLTPLLAELTAEAISVPEGTPDWLAKACLEARNPSVFRLGAAGLVKSAGRAHAHVSRTVKKHLGETPSDYVNRIRMERAARALAGSADALPDIAADLGIPNLSHFHRLFRTHHGMTPAEFRRRYQKNAIQPV